MEISLAFDLIAQINIALKEYPVKNKIWEHKVDDRWTIKLNGFKETKENIPACSALIEYNGFPTGIINPIGGTIVNGSCANEDEFIKALEEKLFKLKRNQNE